MMGGGGGFIEPGIYTRLRCNGHTVMSDTPMEMHDQREIIRIATGRVLIAGLGLGLTVGAVADKIDVASVTVIENAPDVVALVWPHYVARYDTGRICLIQADATTWKPAKGQRWDTAWLDIWDDIRGDYAAPMRLLRWRYRRWADWVGCWCYHEMQRAGRS